MKIASRVVTPQEYDEAAQRHPQRCPLVMMGDLRSGQELIDSAAEDYAQTLGALAGSEAGRARLDGLAERLERQVHAMEQALVRPP